MKYDKQLDTSGLLCPLPILKARKQLTQMQEGEILQVISTDENSILDFKAFSQSTGHKLLDFKQENDKYIFFLEA